MVIPPTDSASLDLIDIRRKVDARLFEFLDNKAQAAAGDCLPGEIVEVLRGFLSAGGKRIRPLLCVVGWYAAAGSGDAGAVIRVAAALEMFHAFALIHDDVMDNSDLRRGRPTVYRTLTALYSGRPGAERLGRQSAILVGDMALTWSDELLHTAELAADQSKDVQRLLDAMRSEVMYGQYLDLLSSGRPGADLQHALKIARYKTAKYTVERPLHLGAALAGAASNVMLAYSAYAIPLGEAFQLRDDLLGAFGDPAQTGKPLLDDLREGKLTALMAIAVQRADARQRATLCSLVGTPSLDESGARTIRDILYATGAPAAVEQMITVRRRQAVDALDLCYLDPEAAQALRQLADAAVARTT